MRKHFTLLCVLMLLSGLGERAFGATMQEMRERGIPEVTPEELFQLFDDNPFAAIERYKTTGIIVSGRVAHIGSTEEGDPFIGIAPVKSEENNKGIAFFFRKIDIPEISKIKKNQPINIHGHLLRDEIRNGNAYIMITRCSIIDSGTQQK